MYDDNKIIRWNDEAYPNHIRTGECNRCGWCCEQEKCPHLSYDAEGKSDCLIWDKLDQPCDVCGAEMIKLGKSKRYTHKVCIDFPNHPYLNCLKSGKCSYKFVPEVKSGDNS